MRLTGVDGLKHLFALAVIFLHIHSSSRYTAELNLLLGKVGDYCDGAVMGFFLISGFFAKEHFTMCPTQAYAFIRKTFQRLLVPFFLFSILYAVSLALLHKGSLVNGLLKTLSLHGSSMQLYFLPYLFYVSIAFYIFTAVCNHFNLRALYSLFIPLILLLALSAVYPSTASTGSDIRLLPLYGACFIIGFYLAKAFRADSRLFYLASLCFLVAFLSLSYFDKRASDIFIVIFLFSVAIYVSSSGLIPNRSLPGSGGIYLLHAPILIYTISSLLLMIHLSNWVNVVVTIALCYITCLLITIVFISKFRYLSFLLLE